MNKKIEGTFGASIPEKEGHSFMAMFQGEVDGLQPVEVSIHSKFGSMMVIGSEEGITYITREQAKAFFGFDS